ncbi:hypothetical protein Pmani_010131 [Petrolisthes manimaculis]|uniref:MAM domain-containing protein n=1 Tax=Petrolisthes manimaculis TaxID=1843537 RepID=A0AAE1Q5K2_9EUCA|nr:hypothetical protein Pmani_010131 [Petrolisthes manimaculis]
MRAAEMLLLLVFLLTTITSSQVVCGLEESLCGLTLEEGVGNWVLTSGEDVDADFPYPLQDHSYNTQYGKFLYLWGEWLEDEVAILESQLLVPEQHNDFCFSFWYLIHVVFEALTGSDTWGTLAVDDVSVVPLPCPEPVSCTFDNGLCRWVVSSDVELQWEVVDNLGNLHDHTSDGDLYYCDFEIDMCTLSQVTTDNFDWEREHSEGEFDLPAGGYLLVDAAEHNQGEKGVITTPLMDQLGVQCLSFKFKKAEGAPASLEAIVTPGPSFPGTHFEDILWRLPDSAVGNWSMGQFPIPHYTVDSLQTAGWLEGFFGIYTAANVFLEVRGVQGNNPLSNIAVDDISITDSVCPGSGHYIAALRQANEVGSKGSVVARLKSPVLTSTLDYCLTFFLHHVGDTPPLVVVHAESSGNQLQWLRHGADSISDGGGGMLVLEPSRYEAGDVAMLRSPLLDPAAAISSCLQFWFLMDDIEEGTVNIYIEVSSEGSYSWQTLWRLRDGIDPQWHAAEVTLNPKESFRVRTHKSLENYPKYRNVI